MANTLTAHQATIVSMEVLTQLRKNLVLVKRVRRDFDSEVGQYGKVVLVPTIGSLSANDKTAATDVTVQDATSSSVSVTLNKHKEATFIIEDIDKALSRNDLLQAYMGSAMIALAEKIEDDLFGLYATFSQDVGTYNTDITAAVVRLARKKLTDGKAPREGRTLVLATKDVSALLAADSQFLAAANTGGDKTRLEEGIIGRYMGFDVMESQAVPLHDTNQTSSLAFHRDAIALVVRPLESNIPSGMGAVASVVNDPESGLSIRAVLSYNAARLGVQCTVDILYGFAEMRDAFGIHVKS